MPIETAVQNVGVEVCIDHQIFTGGQIGRELAEFSSLTPSEACCSNFMLGNEVIDVGQRAARFERLAKACQRIPHGSRAGGVFLGDEEVEKRQIRSGIWRECLLNDV